MVRCRNSGVKRLAAKDCFFKQLTHLLVAFTPYIQMVVISQEAWFEFSVGGNSQAVAMGAEFGVVLGPDNLDLRSIETVFLSVMHPPGDDRL